MTDAEKKIIEEAETVEAFICAIADLPTQEEAPERLLVDFATDADTTIETARRHQSNSNRSICRFLNALASIRDLKAGADPATALRTARHIARTAIQEPNRHG